MAYLGPVAGNPTAAGDVGAGAGGGGAREGGAVPLFQHALHGAVFGGAGVRRAALGAFVKER